MVRKIFVCKYNSPLLSSAPLIDPFNGEGSRPYSQTKNNLLRQQANALSNTGLLPESVIWSYIIQVTVAKYFF